ncbi:hypothetical protein LCGC14_1478910 [marine sediment metagenome]|uniref:Uncharacterized protein n=1 Tax=marine sediment metagenome TaxID=412755 RepID=A0A0F9JAR5_9ZZZZ
MAKYVIKKEWCTQTDSYLFMAHRHWFWFLHGPTILSTSIRMDGCEANLREILKKKKVELGTIKRKIIKIGD